MKDLKYLFAYLAPLTAFLSAYYGGIWSFSTVILSFGLIPFFEIFIPQSTFNHSKEEEVNRLSNRFFDWLIYLNVPILYIIIWIYFERMATGGLALYEVIGMTMSVGIITGSIGINVAHELGHRSNKIEQFLSKLLLLSPLYMHFFIEHNRGHHKNVATDLDPASSRRGETLYAFWVRSTVGGYFSAWNLEKQRLLKVGKNAVSLSNHMIWFQIIQLAYLISIGLFFGWAVVPFAIAIAIIGFLQLETVNYIEHYGLRRKKLANGRYENVSPHHSWNSNHELGRIFLYELTRHSDHHYKASRKFQILRHMDESPQLPYGYPGSMLISFIPPLWFSLMDEKVESYRTHQLQNHYS